ncbi:hypothetical protein BWD09_07110 [Neisseria dentiae]|uniref:Uncharacterized protein n=1 Tax=Neisseria dentiae TaxID=194197 RepID=A0A1X3D9Y8_9NEIS|nr:hypothetical protein [Neisseria dentiae]OSI16524.1 hypothetical protein BWD09_07110 [Neisseria dentiae]QMT44248.1 hypothetical protein H3L92_07060 [Neisseria dentiae]
MTKCYRCANADFKTPATNQMAGFANCLILKQPYTYLPSCWVCDTGKFKQAGEATMERRRLFFRSNGKMKGIE